MNCNLEQLSIEELESIKQAAEQQIQKASETERDRGIRQIQAIAKELGLSVKIIDSKPDKRKFVKQKYRNGVKTWTGRGKPPRWMAEQIAQGKSKEEFRV